MRAKERKMVCAERKMSKYVCIKRRLTKASDLVNEKQLAFLYESSCYGRPCQVGSKDLMKLMHLCRYLSLS